MTDEDFQNALRELMIRTRRAEAETAEQATRKARAEAEAAEHTRDYVRDYYRLPPIKDGMKGSS